MADKEPFRVGGKLLTDLRVVDLKKELEKRSLSKSGSKKDLYERLKAQLQLEKLRENASENQEDDVPVPVKAPENAFIAKYMKQREQLLKDAQDNKKQVQEAKRRESEGHTSASETEGEPRSHAAGIKSPLAQESPLKTASAPSETDASGVTPQRNADEPAKPIEAEKGQGDSELPSHQQRVDSALEKIASKSESQAASVPVPPESNVKVDQSQVAVTEDGKQAQEKNKSEAGGEADVAIKKSPTGTDDSPSKQKSSVESSPRTTRTSVAIAAGKLPEPAVSPKRPARRSKEAEAVGSDSDKLAEDTAPADIVTKADKTDIEVDETDAKTDKTSTKTDERSEVVIEEPEATAATPQSVSDLKSDTTEEPAKAEEPVCEEPVVKESMDSIEKTAPCADTDGKQEEKMDEGSPVKDAVKDEESAEQRKSRPMSRRSRSASSRSASESSSSRSSSRASSSGDESEDGVAAKRKERSSSESASDSQPTPKKSRHNVEDTSKAVRDDDVMDTSTKEAEPVRKDVDETTPATDEKKASPSAAAAVVRPPRKRKWGTTRTTRKASINVSAETLKNVVDVKAEALKSAAAAALEPVIELEANELQSEPDDDNAATGDSRKIQRTVKQSVDDDKRKVVADSGSESDTDARDVRRVTDDADAGDSRRVNGETVAASKRRRDDRLQHTSDSDLSESDDDDGGKKTKEKEASPPAEKKTITIRTVSRQGSSLPVDEPVPVKTSRSPPRRKESTVIHVMNLVRPFTVTQLKELLGKYGNIVEANESGGGGGFWMDKIKSHCFVAYETEDQAMAARNALHGTKWPSSNPKIINVDFGTQADLDWRLDKEKPPPKAADLPQPPSPPLRRQAEQPEERRQRSPRREREQRAGRADVREQKPAPPIREWDRDKLRQSESPPPPPATEQRQSHRSRDRRSRSPRDRRDRRKSDDTRAHSRERRRRSRKSETEAAAVEEPPAKLLDDLFRKTKSTPCIYWLPLTTEQSAQRKVEKAQQEEERRKRIAEREQKEEQDFQQRQKVREDRERERERMREERRRERRRSHSRSRSRRR